MKFLEKTSPKWRLILMFGLCICTAYLLGFALGGNSNNSSEVLNTSKNSNFSKQYDKITRAYEIISKNYVEKIAPDNLASGAIRGMLAELKDPYSVYFDEIEAKQFSESLESSFQGIGTEISDIDGKIIVVAPFKNSPAEKAGLKAKDQIIAIDGNSVIGASVNDVIKQIRGKKNTTVELSILRDNSSKPIILTITRDEIPMETVFSYTIKENGATVGLLEITQFNENTAEDFKKELEKLEKESIKEIIIDVRDNPGGLLSSVEGIINQLLPTQSPYIQIEDRNGNIETFYTNVNGNKKYKIIVLVNQGSASASEILAASLLESGKCQIIGETTFGKGTVQQAVDLGDGSEIKMTFFKWLTPTGKWVHEKGIEPTMRISQPKYFSAHPINVQKPLVINDNNEMVKIAQENLQSIGFAPGRLDGYFDKKTEEAVKAFQVANKLGVTGEIDKTTANTIHKVIISMIKDKKNDAQLATAVKLLTKNKD